MMKWHSPDQNLNEKKIQRLKYTKCLHKTDFFLLLLVLLIHTHTFTHRQRERERTREITINNTKNRQKLNLNKLTINLGIFKMRTHAGHGFLYGFVTINDKRSAPFALAIKIIFRGFPHSQHSWRIQLLKLCHKHIGALIKEPTINSALIQFSVWSRKISYPINQIIISIKMTFKHPQII